MIPPQTSPVWRRFVTGQRQLTSTKLAINLLAKNIEVSYQRDPSSENIADLSLRIHKFFVQYELAFADDLTRLIQ